MIVKAYRVIMDAVWSFLADDGWAIASHIALSALMSLFPFLIFVTSLAAFLDLRPLANETIQLILDTWPREVAEPMAREIYNVVNNVRTDILTIGVALAIYFSSNGIESLRIGLNRAYQVTETRPWYRLRLDSILFVILGAACMLTLSFLVVLGPLLWHAAVQYVPGLSPLGGVVTTIRFAGTSVILIAGLLAAHMWLPAGRRTLLDVAPGIVLTLVLWLLAATAFSFYLSEFAGNYVTTYAGLATAMVALVFLYLSATIFLFGGEFNAAVIRARRAIRAARAARRAQAVGDLISSESSTPHDQP